MIAHRGASADYPENTLAAFDAAIRMGADMVELDVQLTADGEVVAHHDKKVSRCTDGKGAVAACSLAALKALDAGSWFDRKFRGEKIPSLSEVLALCKGRAPLNIEIKTEAVTDGAAGGIEERCLDLVARHGMTGHVAFSSFDPRALLHLRQLDASLTLAVLYEKRLYADCLPSQIVKQVGADVFHCSRWQLTRRWLDDLKAHGIPVNVYTVNREGDMRRLIAKGVNGLFTNRPGVLKQILEELRCKPIQENPKR